MEIKDKTSDGYSLEVFDSISDIPHAEDGQLGVDKQLAFICYEGSLQLRIGERTYDTEASWCFICRPRIVPDRILISPDARVQVFAFSMEAFDQLAYIKRSVLGSLSQLWEPQLIHLTDADLQMISHLHDIVILQRDKEKRSHYKQMMLCLQQAVFYALADAINDVPEAAEPESPGSKDQVFKQFLAILSSYAGRIRSVAAYADMLHVTPKYLSIAVREVSGKTALSWVHYYTTNAIAQRLTLSNKSIKEIAAEMDFPNASFFGRYVKEHLGCTPVEYRERFN